MWEDFLERGVEKPFIKPKKGGEAIVCYHEGVLNKERKVFVHYFPEEGGTGGFSCNAKWLFLMVPPSPRDVWVLQYFGRKLHEKAAIMNF